MDLVYLAVPLLPLLAAIVAGLGGPWIGRAGAHWAAILAVGVSFALSVVVLIAHVWGGVPTYDETVYRWMTVGGLDLEIGFLVDRLTAVMMVVVTFVSLMVHVYTIGYMHDDPGYTRFFSYIALFTFAMLMLVMANNFLQLFFGWEAVGLVSYLLIGFWYRRETAIFANLKAFLVNRVGDLGMLLGIAVILAGYGSLHYGEVFAAAQDAPGLTLAGTDWSLVTVACVLLFIGAMGKSAQVPLHVWLPDSMEGPTPISALIHAATMVTAGIFMVARVAPLYELSAPALSMVLVIGAITAFFLGLVALVQNDIKRVVAYSTISQLGYMVVALGASAYVAGIYHLMTHAFFKALLFLAAGSVIIALHHEQDMRRMGGLKRYMPITYWTMLLGALALIGFPGFSGFFSKDAIIEAVAYSDRAGATLAYWLVTLGVFVTALYTFRMVFMVFHGPERMDEKTRAHAHECPPVVTVPLILLAIPSVIIGFPTVGAMVFGDFWADSMPLLADDPGLAQLAAGFTGAFAFVAQGFLHPPVYLALAGVAVAWYLYLQRPELLPRIQERLQLLYQVLVRKYGFDDLYIGVITPAARALARGLSNVGDRTLIDGLIVNGGARLVGRAGAIVRHVQTGYLFHYAFAMIIGLIVLLGWFVARTWGG